MRLSRERAFGLPSKRTACAVTPGDNSCLATQILFFGSATGNFPTVTRVLLEKIPSQDGKMTIVYDNYVFHYVVENGICYLCMSDELNKHRIPYAFLSDIKDRFLAQYGHDAPLQANAFAYNDEFSRIIQDRLDFYNSPEADHSVDNIGAVKSQIEDVKGVMVQNIEKVSTKKGLPSLTYSLLAPE